MILPMSWIFQKPTSISTWILLCKRLCINAKHTMSTLRKDSGQTKVKIRYLKAVEASNERNYPYSTEIAHKIEELLDICKFCKGFWSWGVTGTQAEPQSCGFGVFCVLDGGGGCFFKCTQTAGTAKLCQPLIPEECTGDKQPSCQKVFSALCMPFL